MNARHAAPPGSLAWIAILAHTLCWGCGGGAGTVSPASSDHRAAEQPSSTSEVVGDADGDGVPDGADECPERPEDLDGFADEDGCPDPDNDADGVADVDDLCPDDASHRSRSGAAHEREEALGCPGPSEREYTDGPPGDLDDDGYPDEVDACPRYAETFPSNLDGGCTDDGDGCPDGGWILLVACEVSILDAVHFPANDSALPPDGQHVLDALAQTLVAHPEFSIAVLGHTDDREREALGQRRAQVVYDALVARGVAPSQLALRAVGAAQPLLPVAGVRGRELAEARERNRRVDFVVTQQPRLPGRPR